MSGFLFGALSGGIAAYYWRDSIRTYMSEGVPSVRLKAAEALGDLGGRVGHALDAARSGVDAAVRKGQRRLRTGNKNRDSEAGEKPTPVRS